MQKSNRPRLSHISMLVCQLRANFIYQVVTDSLSEMLCTVILIYKKVLATLN